MIRTLTSKSQHQCKAIGCTKIVPKQLLMCLMHWRMVPVYLRGVIYKNYRREDKESARLWLDAVHEAIEIVFEADSKSI